MAVLAPIWKDTIYEADASELAYTLALYDTETDTETVIFAGRAYRLPSANRLRINVSKICCNYLSCDIQGLMEGSADAQLDNEDAYREFRLKDSSGNLLQTYYFLYDWSYEDWSGSEGSRSHPVNGRYAENMYKMYTWFDASGVHTDRKSGGYTVPACGDWAIYYLNSYGGWDAFLIEGTQVKTDAITQHSYDRSFDNTTMDYESNRYVAEVSATHEFHTGWLTDSQAENLCRNLMESNNVYIHDLINDRVYPAVISDTSAVYKTYRNQGKKMVNYTITIKESQSRLRK